MSTWRMSLGPEAILIRADLDLVEAVKDLDAGLEAAIYQLSSAPDLGPWDVIVEFAGSGPGTMIRSSDGRVRIVASYADLDAAGLLYLAYVVLESRLQQAGIVTLHAAGVERDGRAVLLLGHPGAGKTISALRLCRQHGFRLLGNDLVVVGGEQEPVVFAGTTYVRLREASIVTDMPELAGLLVKSRADPWRTKTDVTPEQLGISIGRYGSTISAVVFVHVDASYQRLVTGDGDTLVHRLNLHENALRYVRATSTPWLAGPGKDFGPYVPSFDTGAAHRARTHTLQRLLDVSAYVAGPSADVAAWIAGNLPLEENHDRFAARPHRSPSPLTRTQRVLPQPGPEHARRIGPRPWPGAPAP